MELLLEEPRILDSALNTSSTSQWYYSKKPGSCVTVRCVHRLLIKKDTMSPLLFIWSMSHLLT